ncbi:MAG: hypothetical protein AAF990_20285 [Bacteroidota bacterium]
MTFEEFWENYVNEDITTISDEVIEVFRQDLPDDLEEEYDVGEVLAEFTGHHETARNFDKIELFGSVLKEKQPRLYVNEGGYINEALIKYYCFLKDRDSLEEQLRDAISRDYDYDLLLQSIKQLLYNQYITQVNEIIEQEYTSIKQSPHLIEGAEFELAIIKFYIELENLYVAQRGNGIIDFNLFRKETNKYDFNFDDTYIEHLELGLFDNSENKLQALLEKFPQDRAYVMASLEMRFLRSMRSKNCPFAVSGAIWYNLFQYFEGKKSKSWKSYFTFDSNSFWEFIKNKSSFFFDNTIDMALLLWGSSYLLDYLYEMQIILGSHYRNQKQLIEELKRKFKNNNKYDLWEFSFIHEWYPDEGSSLENWSIEKDEFKRSYELEVDKSELRQLNLDELLNQQLVSQSNISNLNSPISSRKIGRNEKIDVEYVDGTIKRGIKYKKVMVDIEEGKCEII